jgi:hypothetical protein
MKPAQSMKSRHCVGDFQAMRYRFALRFVFFFAVFFLAFAFFAMLPS